MHCLLRFSICLHCLHDGDKTELHPLSALKWEKNGAGTNPQGETITRSRNCTERNNYAGGFAPGEQIRYIAELFWRNESVAEQIRCNIPPPFEMKDPSCITRDFRYTCMVRSASSRIVSLLQ